MTSTASRRTASPARAATGWLRTARGFARTAATLSRTKRRAIRGPFSRWMGARPTLPDYLPAIGRAPAAPNCLYAFGHQHLGLTLAAVTAELVCALARREEAQIPLTPFNLSRFGARP